MELKDKIIVITGAASGIGKAMAIRLAEEGARNLLHLSYSAAGFATSG